MINYPKIESLFKRDPKTNYATFLDEYSLPEFEYLKDCQWEWVEKIDGTNIKIYFDPTLGNLTKIGGRTENAQLPPNLLTYLIDLMNKLEGEGKLSQVFDCPVTLYGEGYGPKINKGEKYRDDVSFILFDIRIGHTWLKRKDIIEIGEKLGIEVAPTLFTGSFEMAQRLVRGIGFTSKVGKVGCMAEGLVGQPVIPLLTRMGKRIITKLKTKDFQND